jgi:hypothetical protein
LFSLICPCASSRYILPFIFVTPLIIGLFCWSFTQRRNLECSQPATT